MNAERIKWKELNKNSWQKVLFVLS
jgi:hypothetical protein